MLFLGIFAAVVGRFAVLVGIRVVRFFMSMSMLFLRTFAAVVGVIIGFLRMICECCIRSVVGFFMSMSMLSLRRTCGVVRLGRYAF